jgi:hypothetical protein
MKAEPLDFLTLIGGQKAFKIPVFQRPYSWEKAERETLWLDILSQYKVLADRWDNPKRDVLIRNMPKHYMGTMVLSSDNALGVPVHEVIDGQQRITTILTMLAALRDAQVKAAKGEPDETLEQIRRRYNNSYLLNPEVEGPQKYRLQLQQTDSRCFKAIVNHDGIKRLSTDSIGLGDDESDAVLKTYSYFLRQFTRVIDDTGDLQAEESELDRYNYLYPLKYDILEQVLIRRLSFISILGSSEADDLNAIFESLNAKGKGLSELDLLKNYMFMLLGNRAQDAMDQYWVRIERELPDRDEQGFFVWACMVSSGNYEMQNRLYREIQKQLRIKTQNTEDPSQVVFEYLDSICRKLAHYTSFRDKKHDNPELSNAFSRLRRAGDKIATPVIMWLFSLRSDHQFTDDEFLRGCKLVESFLVRRFLSGEASNNLNSMFGRALMAVHRDGSKLTHVDKLAKALKEWMPGNDTVREGMRTKQFYNQGKTEQRILVLECLDRAYDPGTTRVIQLSEKSIEHIFPQTVTDEWDAAFASHVEEYHRIKESLKHSIGNLTIVKPGENSEVSNLAIREKVKAYKGFEYAMTRRIPEFYSGLQPEPERWGIREISARADELARYAIEIWPESP